MTKPAFEPFAKDTGELSGEVTLYLAQPRADYLRGGYVNVNCELVIFDKELLVLMYFIRRGYNRNGTACRRNCKQGLG